MWPIRKRDDGDKERSGQVVMNGEERRRRGEVVGGHFSYNFLPLYSLRWPF